MEYRVENYSNCIYVYLDKRLLKQRIRILFQADV